MTAQRYKELNGKYLADAERLLSEQDYVQASEKFWGAVATMIKEVATKRGWRHFSHGELRAVMRNLYVETGDRAFISLFGTADRLHANFYEDFLDATSVGQHAQDVLRLMEMLRELGSPGVIQ